MDKNITKIDKFVNDSTYFERNKEVHFQKDIHTILMDKKVCCLKMPKATATGFVFPDYLCHVHPDTKARHSSFYIEFKRGTDGKVKGSQDSTYRLLREYIPVYVISNWGDFRQLYELLFT